MGPSLAVERLQRVVQVSEGHPAMPLSSQVASCGDVYYREVLPSWAGCVLYIRIRSPYYGIVRICCDGTGGLEDWSDGEFVALKSET